MNPEEVPQPVPEQEPKEPPNEQKEAPEEKPKEEPKEVPMGLPKPVADVPSPAPAPAPIQKSEPAKIESGKAASSPGGIKSIINKAKGEATNAGAWIQSHPTQAGLVGAGVALGSMLAGWVIFRALKHRKDKSGKGHRNHPRSIDVRDEIMADFPANAMERRAVMDEIDWDDEEFLEFLSLLPGVDDILPE